MENHGYRHRNCSDPDKHHYHRKRMPHTDHLLVQVHRLHEEQRTGTIVIDDYLIYGFTVSCYQPSD